MPDPNPGVLDQDRPASEQPEPARPSDTSPPAELDQPTYTAGKNVVASGTIEIRDGRVRSRQGAFGSVNARLNTQIPYESYVFTTLQKLFFKIQSIVDIEKRTKITKLFSSIAELSDESLARLEAQTENLLRQDKIRSLPEWKGGKGAKEDPGSFILRLYKPFLDGSFTTRHLRNNDESLARAYPRWRDNRRIPEDVVKEVERLMPTYEDRNDQLLQGAEPLNDEERERLPSLKAMRKYRAKQAKQDAAAQQEERILETA